LIIQFLIGKELKHLDSGCQLKHKNSKTFDCWDSTYEMFYKHFKQHQAIQFKCEKCNSSVRSDQVKLNLLKDENNNCYIDLMDSKNA
jgi:predicted N-acyltransferase